MRGILLKNLEEILVIRFNPAYAGNIKTLVCSRIRFRVQPRVCGEYLNQIEDVWKMKGSTPRMRGIFNFFTSCLASARFNPAYAGNIRYLLLKHGQR